MPRMSNWFGGLLLPVLTWGLLGLSRRRVMATDSGLKPVIIGLVAGLAFGVGMSVTLFRRLAAVDHQLPVLQPVAAGVDPAGLPA